MTVDRDDLDQPGRLPHPVRALLEAAVAPAEPGPQPGEGDALAAFRAHQTSPARTHRSRARMLDKLITVKVAAAALAGGLTLTGVAAAASGSLPDAAQDVLIRIGVSAPGQDGQDGPAGPADPASGGSGEHGSPISDLARDPELTGIEKGAAVSSEASDSKSQAGQHGRPAGETGQGVPPTAPPDRPAAAPTPAPSGPPTVLPAPASGQSATPR